MLSHGASDVFIPDIKSDGTEHHCAGEFLDLLGPMHLVRDRQNAVVIRLCTERDILQEAIEELKCEEDEYCQWY